MTNEQTNALATLDALSIDDAFRVMLVFLARHGMESDFNELLNQDEFDSED